MTLDQRVNHRRRDARLVGLSSLILGPMIGLALALTLGTEYVVFPLLAFLILARVALAMIVPISGIFRCSPGGGRVVLAVYTAWSEEYLLKVLTGK